MPIPKSIAALLLLLFSLVTVAACDLDDLRLTAQFTGIGALAPGDRILYRNKYIGDVERITQTAEGYYLVELDIDSDHKKQLTVHSIFYIDNDPDRPNRKAVITEQLKPGGIPLTDNSAVAGLDHPPYLLNMLDDLKRKSEQLGSGVAEMIGQFAESSEQKSTELVRQLQKSLAGIERKIQQLEKAVRTAPDSPQARELARNLDQLAGNLETTMEQVETMISRDLFKILRESLNDLQHRLEELNRAVQPRLEDQNDRT